MQKLTAHKVPTVAEIDELPDFNVLAQNFIKICCQRKKIMEKINNMETVTSKSQNKKQEAT